MTRSTWFVLSGSILAAGGVQAIPLNGGLENGLIRAIASSGLIGLFLAWYVYTGRQDLKREREEAAKRESRLVERLNRLEDEIRGGLASSLTDARQALDRFGEIADRCEKRADKKTDQ